MPKIADRNKDYFKNPIKNIFDLFSYIQETLHCEVKKGKDILSLSVSTLSVNAERTVRDANIREVIHVMKEWEGGIEEEITYTFHYTDHAYYEKKERERMKTEPEGDWAYRAHLDWKSVNRYLSKEMYVDNLVILQSPLCFLEYKVDELGRGLQTLANIAPKASKEEEGWNTFSSFYGGMIRKSEWLIIRQLGPNRSRWRASLRAGRASISMPYKLSVINVAAPWILGYDLVELCKVFARK